LLQLGQHSYRPYAILATAYSAASIVAFEKSGIILGEGFQPRFQLRNPQGFFVGEFQGGTQPLRVYKS